MSSWHSYPKIYNVGHALVLNIFNDSVLIEEKVDGSQFSFGLFEGEIKMRSKGQEMYQDLESQEKMFAKAVETVKELKPLLKEGWTYRGEYLNKPKHNTLAYDRVPNKYIILFDINPSEELYLNYEEKKAEADRLGLEVVPKVFEGKVENADQLKALLETISILGGQKVEGVVIKNYQQFGPDKKVLMCKHVSEHFKEIHGADWKERNPGQGSIMERLVLSLRTPARWDKAIQHLKERGELTNSPKDIGPLLKEIQKDTDEEQKEFMKEKLYEWAKGFILRGVTSGFPDYYKTKLLESNFEGDKNEQT